MQELLLRVLPTSLRRYIDHAALQELKHSLLDTLSRYVACNGRIIALSRDLVYLVNEHDTSLRLRNIIVCLLEKSRQNALHILSHISGLSKDCRIDNRERDIKHLGYCLSHQCLTCTCRTHHEDI